LPKAKIGDITERLFLGKWLAWARKRELLVIILIGPLGKSMVPVGKVLVAQSPRASQVARNGGMKALLGLGKWLASARITELFAISLGRKWPTQRRAMAMAGAAQPKGAHSPRA